MRHAGKQCPHAQLLVSQQNLLNSSNVTLPDSGKAKVGKKTVQHPVHKFIVQTSQLPLLILQSVQYLVVDIGMNL